MQYSGSCHCGRIAFDVDAEIGQAVECNCSLCSRRGHLLAFVPARQVAFRTPEGDMSTYTFNRHRIRHHFCPTCGVAPLARASDSDGNPVVAVNVRCLEGLDLAALEVRHFDGRSL
jgi:hypothetical protein